MKKFFILLFLLGASTLIFAQEKESNDVKVGLVLSGGGAKGLAHIGVLKVIDQVGVRLDYIAGSSMGAIVGGLYASGYTGKQLDSLFHTVDFPVIDGKISLPKGISNGQNFYNFYSKVTTHVQDIEDFSKLPIPFFCTATDIETGQGLVFDKGNLPEVVVASGALPSVYSPVLYKGKLITDGGVTDNYPVEEIKRRGVELVIGVDVQDSLMTRDELNSLTDVMLQISNFRTIQEMESKRLLTDIYIRPDIKRFSVVGFDDGEAIIKEGEEKALKKLEQLKAIASSQKKDPQVNREIKPIQKIQIDGFNINKTNRYSRAYIRGKMRLKTPSKVSLEDLNEGLDNLYATKNFENIRYRIVKDPMQKNILNIDVKEVNTKSYFRFGLHYDNLYKSAAIVNYSRKKLLFKNDVLSIDGILGDSPRYTLDYYIDKGYYWSVGLRNYFYRFNFVFDYELARGRRDLPNLPVNFLDLDYRDFSTQLYLETLLNESFAFRIGLEQKLLSVQTQTINVNSNDLPGTIFDETNFFGFFSDIKFDSLNDKYFPSKGVFFDGSFNAYPLSSKSVEEFDEFAIAKTRFKYAQSIGKKISILGELAGGIRLGRSEGVNSLDFLMGGFGSKIINNQIPFYGRDFFELSGDSFIKGAVTVDYKLYEKHHVNVTANYANIGNRIFNIEDWFERVGFSGYAVGYGYQSVIGPIQLKYAFSTDPGTKGQLFVSVGYWF